ncbi:MAG: NAD-dependent epimerase/dehydratase family protein [Longimicrobiales bacterium]
MKVFVTGGTGFIGRFLVAELTRLQHEVVCLVRPSSDTAPLEVAGAYVAVGDLGDLRSLSGPMRGCDAVINLAGTYDFWVPDRTAYRAVNVHGTRNVMEAALETGVPKVVHVSTAVVFGNARWPVTERTPYGSRRANEYAETKLEGELIAWRLLKERGLPLVVVYPAAVVGPGDPKPSGRLVDNLVHRRLPARVFPGSPFAFVDVRDVAAALVRITEMSGNLGERYLLGGTNMTFGEITDLICEVAGVPRPRFAMPGWLAMAGAHVLTALSSVTRRPPLFDLSIDQMRMMSLGFVGDDSWSRRELGIEYRPIRTTVADAVASVHPL